MNLVIPENKKVFVPSDIEKEYLNVSARPHLFNAPKNISGVVKGSTITDIVDAVWQQGHIPKEWKSKAIVQMDGDVIDQHHWHLVRPKTNAQISITYSLHGGGGDGEKSPIATILTIVVMVFAAWAGPAVYGAGTMGATLLTAGIAFAGTMLINALFPIRPPSMDGLSDPSKGSQTYSIQGGRNSANPFGTVPVVLGSHKHTPPLGARSYTEIVGNDEYLRMLVVWGYGPLQIENIRIGDTPINSYSDVQLETVQGVISDNPISIFPTDVRQENISVVLRQVNSWVMRRSALDADELNVEVTFPRGLVQISSDGTQQNASVELDIEYRRVGDDVWISLTEIKNINAQSQTFPTRGGMYSSTELWNLWVGYDGTIHWVSSVYGGNIPYGILKATVLVTETYDDNAPLGTPAITYSATINNFTNQYISGLNVTLQASGNDPISVNISSGSIKVPPLAVNRRVTSTVRAGKRWEVDKGQYDIRVRRLTPDTTSQGIFDECTWSVLRTFRNSNPIQFTKPLAVTALRIRATEQLSGAIENLNAHATSLAPIWQDGVWTNDVFPTNNPAALYRLVLMGPANARPRTNNQVDDESLGIWYDFCESQGYQFNMIRDFQTSVWETCADIASAGRAAPTIIDGKWGVIVDIPGKPVSQHFTPRNSWGFESTKLLHINPHAFRVKFINENEDYKQDERVVYDDGYNASNAEIYESIEFPGITNPDLVWKFGRYHIAQARLRPEEYVFNADFENLACQRGDVIRVSHDVTLWGLGWGRVKSLVVDGDYTTGVVIDEQLAMLSDKNYNVRFRLQDGGSLLCPVITQEGQHNELQFQEPVLTLDGPQKGDLAMFGESGTETTRLLIKAIEQTKDLTAKIVCVDEGVAVYQADQGVIPKFDSNITQPINVTQLRPSTPTITNIESGTLALQKLGSTFISRMLVSLQRGISNNVPVRDYRVRYRILGNNDWDYVTTVVDETTVALWPVQDNTAYEIQAQTISVYGVTSLWTPTITELVLGQSEPPQNVTGFAINVVGSDAYLSWNAVTDIDLSHYRIKWSPQKQGATWNSSVDIIPRVSGTSVTVPAQVGTYLIKAVDYSGVESEIAAAVITSIARLTGFNVVEVIDKQTPNWPGEKDRVCYCPEAGGVILSQKGDLYDLQDMYDGGDLYIYGGLYQEGYYYVEQYIDLTETYTTRVSGQLTVQGMDLGLDLYSFVNIYEVSNLYGVSEGSFNVNTEMRITDDDPADVNAQWSDWNTFVVGDYSARGYQFRIKLMGTGETVTPSLSRAFFEVDMEDRIYPFVADIVAGGSRVLFDPSFFAFPDERGLGLSVFDGQEGDKYTITNLNKTGFDIAFTNNGVPVSRHISGIAQSYGELVI